MTAAILVIIVACAIFWLVFFKFRLMRLTPGWGIIFAFFVLHLLLVFVIGLRFVTPNSIQRDRRSTHHPARSAPARADARHRGAG